MAKAKSRPTARSAALQYVKMGWAVVPQYSVVDGGCTCGKFKCSNAGKHPRTRHGVKDATRKLAQIQDWFRQWPESNVAIATGRPSRVVALDVDRGNGGLETLARLLQEHGDLPSTPQSRTGGGGWHFLFAAPEEAKEIRNRTLGPGVELKGDGGMITLPPSRHRSGSTYRWEKGRAPGEVELAELPQWILDVADQRSTERGEGGGESGRARRIHSGSRNEALTRIGGRLRQAGLFEPEMAAALSAVNQNRCRPPIEEGEVASIAQSVARYTRGSAVRLFDPSSEFEPFPLEVFPVPIAQFLELAVGSMGCDVSFLALPLLSVASAAIGNTHEIEVKPGWKQPATVWTAIVGESGTLKTPALKLVTRPARAWEEGQLLEVRERAEAIGEDPPSLAGRLICNDVTVEALRALLGENPRGILLVRDELSGWILSFDAYKARGGGDEKQWIEMFDADKVVVDRRSTDQPVIRIPRAFVGVTGGVQPGILRRAMTQERRDSGFMARILFAYPPRRPMRWREEEIRPCAEAGFLWTMLRLFTLTPRESGEAYAPRTLRFTDEARTAFARFVDELGEMQFRANDDVAAAWSKLIGYGARLSLVLCCMRWACSRGRPSGGPKRVELCDVEAGIRLSWWFQRESERIYGLDSDEEVRVDPALLEFIRGRGGIVTARDVARSFPGARGDSQRAAALLRELVDAGWG
jgi:hypothetical protein